MIGHFILRLTIWFLLTANLSLVNILIGVAIAVFLPYPSHSPERLKDLFRGIGKILLAIPQAYIEAFDLILRPHTHEAIIMERASSRRSPGLVFLDIFLITFTPKTTVLKYHGEGWYEVHLVDRKAHLSRPET
ncbi:Na+/H+ antiporter subunit E [Alkalinema sp. FACHB-956]|uniref:Na+/H+ antiporter subunit E n=1 Tax=Alkalinema sp. FACHB-956 TaxID=2692768 RepID=UPI001685CE29|nr:Na+/H+ antiporter subunit E [Alkalinema sp. FACHB-956]MBD2327538.1 Na+/H+ antiporter subunit E [Alkalinema sp. FACHB-956]